MKVTSPRRRVRRSKEESRERILEAAEALLRNGGPEAVNVRAVGASVGLTDAAVNYHFGTRDELCEALLRHGGHRLKTEARRVLAKWRDESGALEHLIGAIADLYADGGYAALALQLHMAGWRDRGAGLLDDVVEEVHKARIRAFMATRKPAPSLHETRLVLGLLHQTLALDPLFGAEFRRSVGITATAEPTPNQKKRFWTIAFSRLLQ
jgi:TetR/AcrR family transcriptional regulator, repressor for neighboring sulfatase